jgi:hypothetical protein
MTKGGAVRLATRMQGYLDVRIHRLATVAVATETFALPRTLAELNSRRSRADLDAWRGLGG